VIRPPEDIALANTEKKVPTAKEIDALAGLYADAKATAEIAQTRVDIFGDQLIALTKEHGTTPARAGKSLRLEGDEWEVTVSEGQGVSVKKPAAAKIFAALKSKGLHLTFFRKLFKEETSYKLAKGAQELMAQPLPAGSPSNLRKLFADAVQIKDKAPRLTVEPKPEAKAEGK
jgi:hypothetical protein